MGDDGLILDGLVPLDWFGVDGLVLAGLGVTLDLEALLGEGIRDPGNDPDLTEGVANEAFSDKVKASALQNADTLNRLSSTDFSCPAASLEAFCKGLGIPSADNLLNDLPVLESGELGIFPLLERSMLFVKILEDNFPAPALLGHRC